MPFGLAAERYNKIKAVFNRFNFIDEVLVFGSRAMDTYNPASDIDLALIGEKITHDNIIKVRIALEEMPYGYTYDVVDYKKITNPAFKKHIDKFGVSFYNRKHTPDKWKTYQLGKLAEINPKISLKQGNEYSFVEMKDLDPSLKYVSPSTTKELKGGSKFENGDTLFARITPCLENGKICQVKDLKNAVGFGSTEFMVFRGKENLSDTDFIYYLTRTDYVRDNAIQAMTGTSGRQRVEKSALEELEVVAPDLKSQQQIASILSSLDNKIELNLQMNQTLEAMAQAIFKEWFIEFKINGKKLKIDAATGLPKGWKKVGIGELLDTISVTHKLQNEKIIFLNTSDISEGKVLKHEYAVVDTLPGQAKKSIKKNDILYSEIRPANKRYAFIDFDAENYVVSTKLMVLRAISFVDPIVLFYFLKSDDVIKELQMLAESRSGTFPQITFQEIKKIEMIVPDKSTLEQYTSFLKSCFLKMRGNENENLTLIQLRDSLLPQLMTGKIAVPA